MHTPNQPIRIQIVSNGSTIQFFRDGEVVYDIQDPQPFTEGWFGFRTVRNHMTIDDFRVYRLASPVGFTGDAGAGLRCETKAAASRRHVTTLGTWKMTARGTPGRLRVQNKLDASRADRLK